VPQRYEKKTFPPNFFEHFSYIYLKYFSVYEHNDDGWFPQQFFLHFIWKKRKKSVSLHPFNAIITNLNHIYI